MPKHGKRLNRRRNVGRASSSSSMAMVRPPQISSNPRMRHRFRFGAGSSGSGTYTITNNDVLLACGGICTTANSTITAIFSAFRIVLVEAWAQAGAAPATVSLNWNGAPIFVTNAEVSDTSVSSAFPVHIKAVPPKGSNAAFWQTASSNSLFVLTVPNDTVIDVLVDLVMSDQQDVDTVTGVSTASLGAQYFLALDGAASNQLIPQSLSTTH
jgi:hypothetical protein